MKYFIFIFLLTSTLFSLEESPFIQRQNFPYAVAKGGIFIVEAGIGYRAVMNSYLSTDLSASVGIKPEVTSDISFLALYYPVRRGFYAGLGGGYSYGQAVLGAMANDSRELSNFTTGFLMFGRASIGYEWRVKKGNIPMFIELRGPLPSLIFGVGF